MPYYNHMYGMGLFGGFWALIFWIVFIVFVVWVVKVAKDFYGKETNEKSKDLNILKERYAKGEIDKKEYEEKKKKDLES